MSQGTCDLRGTANKTQSAFRPGQLLMSGRVRTLQTHGGGRGGEGRRRERLRLRVFKSLPASHATAMCALRYTCRG